MANKKLKVELELETAKAKRQAAEVAQSSPGGVDASAGSGSAAAARSAAKGVKELGDAAHRAAAPMNGVVKAFAGMAIGMAANYAAKSMPAGGARTAVEYGGAAASGAMVGMIAGPIGAAVGALGGMLKTYLEKEGTKNAMTAEFNRGEQNYAADRAFRQTIDELTDVGDAFENLKTNIDRTKEELEKYRTVEQDLIEKVKKFREAGDEESAKLQEGYLARNRGRQESLESVLKSLERQQKDVDKKGEYRVIMSATDSLSKVGAVFKSMQPPTPAADAQETSDADAAEAAPKPKPKRRSFGFSVLARKYETFEYGDPSKETDAALITAAEASLRAEQEMASTLKSIAENTKGSTSWQ